MSEEAQWKSVAIAIISIILLQVLFSLLLFQIHQQNQEIELKLTDLEAIKARYIFLNHLLEKGVVPSYAAKWKNVKIADPDPKSDSIKIEFWNTWILALENV